MATTDLMSLLPELVVTPADVQSASSFLEQYLQAKFPTLDLREGTAIRDLTLRPAATLSALLDRAVQSYFSSNKVSQVSDTTDTTVVDALMSNWFMTRNQGGYATLSARLFFSVPTSGTIATTVYFSPDGTHKYFPANPVSFTAANLLLDAASQEHYLDIELVSDGTTSDYNISSGSLLYFTNFNIYFLRAEINYLVQEATPAESNTAFVSRVGSAISTRNLINKPSIDFNLRNTFPSVKTHVTLGYGDFGMLRDLVPVVDTSKFSDGVQASVSTMHIGGKVDIYHNTGIASSIVDLTSDSNGVVTLTGPIYSFRRVAGDSKGIPLSATFKLDYPGSRKVGITSIAVHNEIATISVPGHSLSPGSWLSVNNVGAKGFDTTYLVSEVSGDVVTAKAIPGSGAAFGSATSAQTWSNAINARPIAWDTVVPYQEHSVHIEGVEYISYVDPTSDHGFSTSQTYTLDFGSSYANKGISLEIFYFPGIDTTQTYLASDSIRVVCSDALARAYNHFLLDFTLSTYSNVPIVQSDFVKAIQGYLDTLSPGQAFITSDLYAHLSKAGLPGISIGNSSVEYTFYSTGLTNPAKGKISDQMLPLTVNSTFVINSVQVTKAGTSTQNS